MRRVKKRILNLLRFAFTKLGLRGTVIERKLKNLVYSNSLIRDLVIVSKPRGVDVPFDLQRVILNFDHDQICAFQSESQPLLDFLAVSSSQVKQYVEYLAEVGFLPTSEKLPNSPLNFRLCVSSDFTWVESVIRIEKESSGVVVTVHESLFDESQFENWMFRILALMRNYPVGVVRILERCQFQLDKPYFYLDISDGALDFEDALEPGSNVYTFCRKNSSQNIGLIPDAYTLHDLEYEEPPHVWESKAAARLDYNNRIKKIFWRGSTTGRNQSSIRSNRRVQFCLRALQYPQQVDAKITNTVQFDDNRKAHAQLNKKKVIAPPVTEAEFGRYTSFIDLEGNSTAWGSFRKFALLIHVIRPACQFELFYYSIQPADSFTFVKHESEIFENLDDVPTFADNFEVAWQGYKFALKIRQMVMDGEGTIHPK